MPDAIRFRRLTLTLSLALTVGFLGYGPTAFAPSASDVGTAVTQTIDQVRGMGMPMGWACVACVGGGIGYLLLPPARILAKLAKEGSTLAAAACIYVCHQAIFG